MASLNLDILSAGMFSSLPDWDRIQAPVWWPSGIPWQKMITKCSSSWSIMWKSSIWGRFGNLWKKIIPDIWYPTFDAYRPICAVKYSPHDPWVRQTDCLSQLLVDTTFGTLQRHGEVGLGVANVPVVTGGKICSAVTICPINMYAEIDIWTFL